MAALCCYLGMLPFVAFATRNKTRGRFLQHHLEQATGIFLLLGIIILVFVLVVALISVVIVTGVVSYQNNPLEAYALTTTRRLFLCWLVFWVFGSGLALLGWDRRMPLVVWLGERRWVQRLTWTILLCICAFVALAAPVVAHSVALARPAGEAPPVVMLYEDNDMFPRWLFAAAFYPASLEARRQFGPGSVAVVKLTEASLRDALRHARFLFIGSHGGVSGLLLDGEYFGPERLEGARKHAGLEFVYLAGCDSGALREEWEEALAPATVIAFERSTAVVEHAWWLWTRGPEMVEEVAKQGAVTPAPASS